VRVSPALPQAVADLAQRAELLQQPQTVPLALLRELAEALAALAYVGAFGCPWCQRVAREGVPPSALPRGPDPAPSTLADPCRSLSILVDRSRSEASGSRGVA